MTSDRRLGRTEIALSPIGLGCWQFSQRQGLVGKAWRHVDQPTANAIVRASLDGGINWFDTAELYGHGRSEQVLAAALIANGKHDGEPVIATKWSPLMRTARSIKTTIAVRNRMLAPFHIDLHQVHSPKAFSSVESMMEAMADLVAAGSIRAVGVSNFSAQQMRAAHAALAKRALPLASNQMQYNLLSREIERNGVLQAAKELGISLIAYSPLAQGVLSGRYHDDPTLVKATGFRRFAPWFRRRNLERSRPLIAALRQIAEDHGATPSQIALCWLISFHGDTVIAIPGATHVEQARSNAAALQLQLSGAELARLDALSRDAQ